MKPKHLVVHILAVILAFPFLGTLTQAATITIEVLETFNYPGRGNLTRPQKINNGRSIVGEFVDSSGATRGFVRAGNGNFSSPLIEPNDDANFTEGRGINDYPAYTICGDYLTSDGTFHGFFLGAFSHIYTDYDVPGSVDTNVLGINNVGDFVGNFIASDGIARAFYSLGGTVTEIDIPGATFSASYQLNGRNVLVGYCIDSASINHGFYQDDTGALQFPIDPPGSTGTILFGINDKGWMVGRFSDSTGVTHGLLFIAPHKFVQFDYPASTTFTSLNGINNKGYICGRYTDEAGIEYGFTARATTTAGSDAEIETNINVPAAPVRPKVPASSERPSQVPAS